MAILGDPTRVSTVADDADAARLGAHPANARNDFRLLVQAAALGRQGLCTPRVGKTCSLEQIREAHAHSAGGHGRGRFVVPHLAVRLRACRRHRA